MSCANIQIWAVEVMSVDSSIVSG